MAKLFLLRHIKSVWNEENRFTGQTDIPLNQKELGDAKVLASKIAKLKIDKIYSSALFRNQDTISRILQNINDKYLVFVHLDEGLMKDWGNYKSINKKEFPVYVTEALNERYYGKLQGLNKKEVMKKYGEAKVQLWRRSYDIAPPGGESLKDVEKRTTKFFNKYIKRDLLLGKNILIVGSHNPLRAIIKLIEKISEDDIINMEVPYGGFMEYELNKLLKVTNKKILK